jgi:DNA (cytosine-5)-methyltransferase 1
MGVPEVDGSHIIPWPAQVAPTLNAAFGSKQGLEDQHIRGGAGLFVPGAIIGGVDYENNGHEPWEPAGPLMKGSPTGGGHPLPAVAFGLATPVTPKWWEELSPTLTQPSPTGGGQPAAVALTSAVRRLTPVECERLQGFPDNYTAVPWHGKDQTPDGPRYKALGNSMAVPVMRWIGERIQEQEK